MSSTPGQAAAVMPPSRRAALLFALAASGAAGLVYEVAWIRSTSLIVGATTPALGMVLAWFFAGLGIGSAWFGRVAMSSARPLRLYGYLELGIALFGLASVPGLLGVDALLGLMDDPAGSGTLGRIAETLLVGLVLLPPAVFMGGTLPLFCRQFVTARSGVMPGVGWLFALNTLGAAIGCATTGLYLLPTIGLRASIGLAAVLNVVAAAVALRAAGQTTPLAERESAAPPATSRRRAAARPSVEPSPGARGVMAALFFLTGAIALGNQVLWSRFAALIVPNTILTYTLTLTMVLVGLVIGSALATRLEPGRHHVRTFGALQVLTGVVVLAVAFLAPETWQALGDRTRMYLLLFLPASVLSGASFPLAVRIVTGDPTRVALDVGRLGAVNTLGGIVGSLAAAFLLPVVGLSTALHVTTALSVVAGCTTWMALDRRSPLMARWVLSGLAVGTWVAIARVSAVQLPRDFLGDPSTLVAVVEGAESNLAVSRSEGRLLLTSDGWWQGQDEKSNQIMAAHVPMLLHANPQSALVVGVGAGQTPARFMLYPIDRLDVVDIEPAVFDVVRDYFDAGWMRDPRVRLLAEDGRAVLRRGRETYDVVSIEVGQIMRPGVAAFYTRDAYVDARRRLAPGGIVGQFVPLSFLTPDTFRGIVRTFVDVFPQSVLWYNRSELLLIGFAADRVSIDPDRLALLDRNAAVREDLRFSLWGGAAERQNRPQVFLSGFLVGPDGLAAIGRGATVYSDDRPELDYAAAAVVPEDISHDPLIAEIRAHVEPLSAVLNTPMTDDRLAAVAALQQRNLDDLTAWSLARQAGFLDATDPGRGIRLLERAREANPDSVRVLTLLGTDYLRAGRTPEALTVLERGAAIDPNDSQVQRDLGFAFGQVGRWEEAISHLQIATGLQPNDAYAYYLLGVALQATGRAAEGEEHLRRALELWPGFQPAIEALR